MAEKTGETTEKTTEKDRAYIIFTKAPERGKVKTRMKPFYDDDQCLELQKALIMDGLRSRGGDEFFSSERRWPGAANG